MQPIGIFDSGVGGLGIFERVAHYLSNEDLIYIGDNKNCPYGEKTVDEIQRLSFNILNFLVTKHNIKLAVVACNTMSTTSLAFLREHFSIPIIGVVPIVKPACELTKTKKIAMLATPRTANSDYQKQLIFEFATDKGIDVLNLACPDLVRLVEKGDFESEDVTKKLQEYLAPINSSKVDVIGLCCTHFPFLKKQIEKLVDKNIVIIDSNDAVAKQVVRVLNMLPKRMNEDKNNAAKYMIYATKDVKSFAFVAKKLLAINGLDKGNLSIQEVVIL